ncbi:MAG: hypothetical protein IT199_03605 [Solirubrobacterales bacterium]|nr:hypothetical protein [Solirubrobacterales bacterium]
MGDSRGPGRYSAESKDNREHGRQQSAGEPEHSDQESPLEGGNPVLEPVEPIVDLSEPLVDLREPLVDLSEPLVDLREPLVDLSESIVDLREPLVDLNEPIVYLNESIVDLREPLVDLREPLVHAGETASHVAGEVVQTLIAPSGSFTRNRHGSRVARTSRADGSFCESESGS